MNYKTDHHLIRMNEQQMTLSVVCYDKDNDKPDAPAAKLSEEGLHGVKERMIQLMNQILNGNKRKTFPITKAQMKVYARNASIFQMVDEGPYMCGLYVHAPTFSAYYNPFAQYAGEYVFLVRPPMPDNKQPTLNGKAVNVFIVNDNGVAGNNDSERTKPIGPGDLAAQLEGIREFIKELSV